uniref:Calmodulin-regulated spectrin-associated protein 1 n=1 Tax=Elaeophora elaphi TaxID=1147741 RepID=A0A0R3S414_9BILA
MEEPLPGIIPINCYNVEKGKLSASVKWLIGRVYGSTAPDLLVKPIKENTNNTFQLEAAVVTGLTNASLYSNAAAKIFKDQSLLNKPHSVVLRALANHSIPITLSGEEANINEAMLSTVQPFHQAAHLAIMDSLMIAHMRSIITIDKVVEAVQSFHSLNCFMCNKCRNYTTVDKREEPMDGVDALLFWINKICLLVRDDMEKFAVMNKNSREQYASVVVPEMEDLYEDMCDGACICALIGFYRPNEMVLRGLNKDICFNDPMSLADCQYNLILLRKFCSNLPWNPFHFEIEDILYLHESLQPNVNAFLADLFQIFEGDGVKNVASPTETAPVRARYFVPVNGIPDLRSQAVSNKALNQFRSRFQPEMSRTFSAMSSDSLMTNRSGESAKHHYQKNFVGSKTNFGELTQCGDRVSGVSGFSQGGTYIRSDSMPAASIRLALEEKRREHEKRRYLETNQSESERAQKQKDAFFTLMQRLEKGSDTRSRAASEIGNSQVHESQELSFLKETVQDLKKRLQEMSVQQEHLSRQVDEQRQMTHAISQPAIHTEFGLVNEPHHVLNSSYATLPHNAIKPLHQTQQHTYATPYMAPVEPQLFGQSTHQSPDHNQSFPMHTLQMPLNGYSNQPDYQSTVPVYASHVVPSSQLPTPQYQLSLDGTYVLHSQDTGSHPVVGSPFMLANAVSNSTAVANNTFRLHRNDASSSRLDPSLEINRNLTNWGLTYKAGQTIRPQRRTWDNRTFAKSEMDLSNQPEFLPGVPSHLQNQSLGVSENVNGVKTPESLPLQQRESNVPQHLQQTDFDPYIKQKEDDKPGHQQSPPKDPISSTNADLPASPMTRKLSSTRASQFIVDDATEKPVINVTPEMEAKREALLAKTLRRREQIEQKVGEIEAKNAERRQAELERQEAAEQRKRERELQRLLFHISGSLLSLWDKIGSSLHLFLCVRQRILDDYKRKKMEKELENNEIPNGRGYNQPPLLPRPKSTMEGANLRTKRSSRPQSSFEENSAPSSARIPVPSTAEPTLKLFSKYVHKSNRSMIINALQYSVFPGSVWDKQRAEVLGELAKSDSKHFLLLFRDQKCRYLGAYSWDQQSDTAHRIHGKGPNICHESMMHLMFKYDSGAKKFSQIPTKHLSATIDGFTLHDQYMQGPKIPHSNSIGR